MPDILSMNSVFHHSHKNTDVSKRISCAIQNTMLLSLDSYFLMWCVGILLSNYNLIKNIFYCISTFRYWSWGQICHSEIWCDSHFKFRNWLARDLQGHDPSKHRLSNCPDTRPTGKLVFDGKCSVEKWTITLYWYCRWRDTSQKWAD